LTIIKNGYITKTGGIYMPNLQTATKDRKPGFKMSKPYLLQMSETRPGQKFTEPSITEQKGWLSPGNQLRRLQEAGERLEAYRMENYDEYYYGDEEPSLDPIRTAEDLQDEMLIMKDRMERAKKAHERVAKALKEREELEKSRAEKKKQEAIDAAVAAAMKAKEEGGSEAGETPKTT
jgi:hypothetical protein